MKKLLFLPLIFLVGLYCYTHLNKPSRGYYYWKSRWIVDENLLAQLELQKINKIYIKFFDLTWNTETNEYNLLAPLSFKSPWPEKIEMIPVIFIDNSVFQKPSNTLPHLSEFILKQIHELNSLQNWKEIQIDCDWTTTTKINYFSFLEDLKKKIPDKLISATIRLHQLKYSQVTGVPPVDYGSLMLYNMGELKPETARISIFNKEDTLKYIYTLKKYKLKLDLALPLFSWFKVIRNKKIISLLSNVDVEEIQNSDIFKKIDSQKYIATESNFFRGRYFKKDDELILENIDPEITKTAANIAKNNSKNNFRAVVLFDLNKSNQKYFKTKDINEIFYIF